MPSTVVTSAEEQLHLVAVDIGLVIASIAVARRDRAKYICCNPAERDQGAKIPSILSKVGKSVCAVTLPKTLPR